MSYILIVDDEDNIRKLIVVNLQARGFTVIEASSAEKALLQMRQQQPLLVILDLLLPDMDGWEMLRAMMMDDQLATVPAIVVTAAVKEEATQKILMYPNALQRIYKPLHIDELVAAVKSIAESAQSGK